jgi:hypothetical protein
MSCPPVLQLRQHTKPELRPLRRRHIQPQNFLLAVLIDAQGHIDGVAAHQTAAAQLHADAAKADRTIERLKLPRMLARVLR